MRYACGVSGSGEQINLTLLGAVECKAGKGKTTALQDRELAAIKTAGGYDLVVNENNLDDVDEILKTIDNYHQEGETCS